MDKDLVVVTMAELKPERIGDLEIGQEVQYQNAVYKVVHKDDRDGKVYLEFCRNKFGGYPSVEEYRTIKQYIGKDIPM